MGSGHAGADPRTDPAVQQRKSESPVQGGENDIRRRAARSDDFHGAAIVAVTGPLSETVAGGDGEHLVAHRRRRGCDIQICRLVASGDDHHRPAVIDIIDRGLPGDAASARCRQAQVEDARRVGILRDAGQRDTGCPAHRIDDVRGVAAAFSQHAQGQDHRPPVDPGNADTIVCGGCDGSCHMGAMPAAVRGFAAKIRRLRNGHPVAGVAGIRIAPVTVVGGTEHPRTVERDEVVARQHLAAEIRVSKQHTGVEHRHGHCIADDDVPGSRSVDTVVDLATGDHRLEVPLLSEARVVGGPRWKHPLVRFGVLHSRQLRQGSCHGLHFPAGQDTGQSQYVGAAGHGPQPGHVVTGRSRQACRPLTGAEGEAIVGQQARAHRHVYLDDDAIRRRGLRIQGQAQGDHGNPANAGVKAYCLH